MYQRMQKWKIRQYEDGQFLKIITLNFLMGSTRNLQLANMHHKTCNIASRNCSNVLIVKIFHNIRRYHP